MPAPSRIRVTNALRACVIFDMRCVRPRRRDQRTRQGAVPNHLRYRRCGASHRGALRNDQVSDARPPAICQFGHHPCPKSLDNCLRLMLNTSPSLLCWIIPPP